MTLEEIFLIEPGTASDARLPSVDPLQDEDGLLDAQILDLRYDAIRSTLGIVLELRVSELLDEANTGLIVASNVTTFAWDQVDRHSKRTAWIIDSSRARRTESGISVELTAVLGAGLRFSARQASFYFANVPHLGESAPPDYSEPDFSLIRRSIATWNSPADIVSATHYHS